MQETNSQQHLVAVVRQGAVTFKLGTAHEPHRPVEAMVKSPQPRYAVAEGLWLDYRPDAGVDVMVSSEPEGLRLKVEDVGTSPWFSLSHDLDLEQLCAGRYLLLLVQSSSKNVRFRACLRYHLLEGFKDIFCREVVVLTGAAQQDLLSIPIDAELASIAHGVETLYFFEGRRFDVMLQGIEAHFI